MNNHWPTMEKQACSDASAGTTATTRPWAYTECDRHASLGAQLSGIHWRRDEDRVGIAYAVDGLSAPHKDYLAAGGIGILLGDGALNYGLEQTLEIYYRIQVLQICSNQSRLSVHTEPRL